MYCTNHLLFHFLIVYSQLKILKMLLFPRNGAKLLGQMVYILKLLYLVDLALRCILFHLFLRHGYVPDAFCKSIVNPLVKCKSGDLSDVNNYRAIALANSVSKILESALFDYIDSYDPVDEYQFGFRKNVATNMCTHVFKKTVQYYRQHGSYVFTCFIDFNKAFDNVDYRLLFSELIDYNNSTVYFYATRLLAFWYNAQTMCVRWQNICSSFLRSVRAFAKGAYYHHFYLDFIFVTLCLQLFV